MNRELMQRALRALEESLDAIRLEYASDWRHGIPSRKGQVDNMRALLDEHEAVIRDLRAELTKAPPPPAPPPLRLIHEGIKIVQPNGVRQPALPDLFAIKAEADNFIEWPTADRTAVLTTTAMLFARHCAEKTANGTWP